MFKFLLQTIEGKVRHDFVFEMEHAIDYQNWRGNQMIAEYCSLEDIKEGCLFIDSDEINEYIPIGTVEFVYAFVDKFIKEKGSKEIKPLNVPEELFEFAGRKIGNYSIENNSGIREKLYHEYSDTDYFYLKSNKCIKSDINSSYNADEIQYINTIPNGEYQISEYIDIVSEYRCFVYNDKLVGIQYYSGEFDVFPDTNTIYEMLDKYRYDTGNAPQAWTLDVAIDDYGKTIVMECHEFFSCGLYGFNDYNVLPYMFVRTFNNIKRRLMQ